MRDYIGKKCEQSLYLNSKLSPENKFKMEAFWFVFKSFCYQIFINFPKKVFGGVGGTEKSRNPNMGFHLCDFYNNNNYYLIDFVIFITNTVQK